MPNRISGYKPAGSSAPLKGTGASTQVDKASGEVSSSASASSADQVTFTGPALALQKLGAAVANAPVVNAQKVAAVKVAVQNGTYKIDAGSVADKILQFERGLK